MSRIKRLTMAAIVTLALASATFGGNIHTGVIDPPPPPPANSQVAEPQSLQTPGEISTGLTSSDLGAEIILNLLQLLSVY